MHKKTAPPRTRAAFTLIELLVVFSILTVLSALVFSVLSSSRKKSDRAISLNNLKQWGSALDLSLADFAGRLPSDGTKSGELNREDQDAWFNRLPLYLKTLALNDPEFLKTPPKIGDRTIWVNPSVPSSLFAEFNSPPDKFLFSYAMNDYLSSEGSGEETGGDRTIPKVKIQNPSATIFMTEQADEKPAASPKTIRALIGSGDPKGDPENAVQILFCDGHIALFRRDQWDPEAMDISTENPSTLDDQNLNPHITFIPFPGATP